MVDFQCVNSPSGRHEFHLVGEWLECAHCDIEVYAIEEIVNAAMLLTPDDARAAAKDSYTATHNPEPRWVWALRAYADRLEQAAKEAGLEYD